MDGMSDELAQREMTLAEWVGRLHEQHTARREYAALVVRVEQAEAAFAYVRQQAADMERGVADALTGAMGDHDLGVVAGVELLAERYAALRQRHETEITLERDCYAALSSAIVTATGVDVPVGGMTALQAVKALRQRHAAEREDAFRMGFRASEHINDVDVDINAEGKAVAKWRLTHD